MGYHPENFVPVFVRADWMSDAACRGQHPNTFHPQRGRWPTKVVERFCADCPVRDDCLRYALADPSLHGIWGGTSEKERHRMRGTRRLGRPTIRKWAS